MPVSCPWVMVWAPKVSPEPCPFVRHVQQFEISFPFIMQTLGPHLAKTGAMQVKFLAHSLTHTDTWTDTLTVPHFQ